MSDRRASDRLLTAARELVSLGGEDLFGVDNDFVAEVSRLHPARDLYLHSTARAIDRCDLAGLDSSAAAEEVFTNFIWTQFGCKLLMTAAPEATAVFVANHFDTRAVIDALDVAGPSILSCFHYTGFPLVAFALAMSPASPLISKARIDVLDRSRVGASDQIVHVSSRSAPILLTRALRQGRSVWVLLDVVLPSVRVFWGRLLGGTMAVGAGMGKIARLSGRPCLPVSWVLEPSGTRLESDPPVLSAGEREEEILQAFLNSQAAFIRRHPTEWLEWYGMLDDAPRLRAEVKRGNDEIWGRLGEL